MEYAFIDHHLSTTALAHATFLFQEFPLHELAPKSARAMRLYYPLSRINTSFARYGEGRTRRVTGECVHSVLAFWVFSGTRLWAGLPQGVYYQLY